MRRILVLAGCGSFLAAALISGSASAQLSNKPYSFRNGGGIGMSQAARQAIINQKYLGETPKNILRGANGELLTVNRGPSRAAIVTNQAGVIVSSYRGRGRAASFAVGAHNGFFAGNGDATTPYIPLSSSTAETIDSWTSGVVYGRSGGGGGGSVDQWTGMVAALGY